LFIRIKDNEIEETKQLMKELTNNNRNKSNVNYKFQKIIRVPIAVRKHNRQTNNRKCMQAYQFIETK